jgi:hypothetical protein
MSNFVTALLLAIGGGTWVYLQALKRTGGNTKSALTVAGICAGILFVAALLALAALFQHA